MPEREPAYVLNNRKRLRWPVAAAPKAAAFLTGAGAMIVVGILFNTGQGHLAIPLLLIDIGIGYWQGWLLARYLEAQAAAPRTSAANFFSVLGRGALTGFLIGFMNGAFLLPQGGGMFFQISILIGLGAGLVLGFLIGLAASLYLNSLETDRRA